MSIDGDYAKGYPGKDLYFKPHKDTGYQAFYECGSTVCEPHYPSFIEDIAKDEAQRVALAILWFTGIGQGANKFMQLLDSFSSNVRCDSLWIDMPEIDDSCLMKLLDVIGGVKSRFVKYSFVTIRWTPSQFRLLVEQIMIMYGKEARSNHSVAIPSVLIEADSDFSKEDAEFLTAAASKHKSRLFLELEGRLIIDSDLFAQKRKLSRAVCDVLIDAFYERPTLVTFNTKWPRNSSCKIDDRVNACHLPDCVSCKVNLLRKRNLDMCWRNVHPLVLKVSICLVSMQLPHYVLLEIINWLPPASLCDRDGNDWNRFAKMQLITSVYRFYREKKSI